MCHFGTYKIEVFKNSRDIILVYYSHFENIVY